MNLNAVDKARNLQADYNTRLNEILEQRAAAMKQFDQMISELDENHQAQMEELFNQL